MKLAAIILKKAYLYRANGEVEIVAGFEGKKLSGEDVMPGMAPLDDLRIRKS